MLRLTVTLLLGVLAHQTFADEPEAIVGGTPAAPGEFPYQCGVSKNNKHFCGCSILSASKILTAAHCVENILKPYENYAVRTGSIDDHSGNMHAIKSIEIHPVYQSGARFMWNNDIAVITLQDPIQFSANEAPVKLASSPSQTGTRCVVSGWGRISTEGLGSQTLLKLNTVIVNKGSCTAAINLPLLNTHICAFNSRETGICLGDSGGPLVCNGEQYGIVSFGKTCAKGAPDVYTNVHHHRSFIEKAMAN